VRAPSISGTEVWGARPATGPIEVLDQPPNRIIVHHTATANSDDTSLEHAFALSREIQNLHMDNNGWLDTGQNFTNSRGGHRTEGRHQSLAALQGGTQHAVGTHAGAQNRVALGIENEGTYTSLGVPAALWTSLVDLCTYMVRQYGIAPGEIYGHRDFMSTECPGDVLYARLPELREAVGKNVNRHPVHPVTWPLLRPGMRGPTVTALQLLLRGRAPLPVDGVFAGDSPRVAGEFLAERHLTGPSCYATRTAEPGLFGGTAWESLVPVLNAGDRGDAVRAVQVLLTSHGHHPGTDMQFTDPMVAAVRAFQAARGLATTGVVDQDTWKHLVN
jgi:hypothetical protein